MFLFSEGAAAGQPEQEETGPDGMTAQQRVLTILKVVKKTCKNVQNHRTNFVFDFLEYGFVEQTFFCDCSRNKV